MSIAEKLEAELKKLTAAGGDGDGVLAEIALRLARTMDETTVPPQAMVRLASELRTLMRHLIGDGIPVPPNEEDATPQYSGMLKNDPA